MRTVRRSGCQHVAMAERGPTPTAGDIPEPLVLSEQLLAVYRQILSGRSRGPIALSELGQDREANLRAVDALADHGLVDICSDEGGSEIRLRATNPIVRLAEMVASREQALRDHEREVEQLRVMAATLTSEFQADRDARAVTVMEHLMEPAEIVARLEELYAHADRELRIFVTNRQSPEGLEAARESDLALLRRGLRVRLLCLESLTNDRAHLDYLRWYTAEGAEIRLLPTLPLRMILQDEQVAVVAAHGEDPSQGAVILRGHGIVRALGALFERYWESAHTYGDAPAAHTRTDWEKLTPAQSEIIRLMASGAKDDAIARRLGVSVRTVRRLTSELAARLQVESRFAFGVEAVRRGWVDAGAGKPLDSANTE